MLAMSRGRQSPKRLPRRESHLRAKGLLPFSNAMRPLERSTRNQGRSGAAHSPSTRRQARRLRASGALGDLAVPGDASVRIERITRRIAACSRRRRVH